MREIIEQYFTRFQGGVDKYALPERFTFPFYYQPHPLCVLAAEQLQAYLLQQNEWQHNFGLSDDPNKVIGKMFGVLLVKNTSGELGFLSAFSGKLAGKSHIDGFVPPVFDLLTQNSFFLTEQPVINQLTQALETLEKSSALLLLRQQWQRVSQQSEQAIAELRSEVIENRKQRKKTRNSLHSSCQDESSQAVLKGLAEQSVYDKWRIKELTVKCQGRCDELQSKINTFEQEISRLKQERKRLSSKLQKRIFTEYRFLNQAREQKSLLDIFSATTFSTPPAGAGECAAPKLLHYAFLHNYQPVAMAEFWWGASPKSEVKKHQQYYPACKGKCEPILKHMLHGIELDENPLLKNYAQGKALEIIYQDDDLLVVNKPAEFLSVPGKEVTDSVYQRIKQQFPMATGPLIVHRLDMSTSGLMVLALNSHTNKALQKQFIRREVTKEYVALVEGLIEAEEGEINLPLRGDLYDRPKQLVCHEHGKSAKTTWQVIQRFPESNRSQIRLSPFSGRTHQLRVHCAHVSGLNMPIVGDDLYGNLDSRLHLHAQRLSFVHPTTQNQMSFERAVDY